MQCGLNLKYISKSAKPKYSEFKFVSTEEVSDAILYLIKSKRGEIV